MTQDGNCYYVHNGIVPSDTTTLVKYEGQWYYIVKGILAKDVSTLVKFNNGWYYVIEGRVASEITTVVNYHGGWYQVESGKVTGTVRVPSDQKQSVRTLFVYAPNSWKSVSVFSSSPVSYGDWPGRALSGDEDWYWIELPLDQTGLILHNGDGCQTAQLDIGSGSDVYVVLGDDGSAVIYDGASNHPQEDTQTGSMEVLYLAPSDWDKCSVYWWGSAAENPD